MCDLKRLAATRSIILDKYERTNARTHLKAFNKEVFVALK